MEFEPALVIEEWEMILDFFENTFGKRPSEMEPILLMIGMMILYSTGNALLLSIGVALFALATLFSFVTLPVEFDASNRALAWIKSEGIVSPSEYEMSKDALWWAAMTYVVAALGMLAQLLYYLNLLGGRRSDD